MTRHLHARERLVAAEAAAFNARHSVGARVRVYPGFRPEDDAGAEVLTTRTRSEATVLGGHTAVVWVEGHGACIALTHVDSIPAVEESSLVAPGVGVGGRGV